MPDAQVLEVLYDLRRQASLSQNQVAKIIGVRRKTISDWETGKVAASPMHRTPFLKYLLETLKLGEDMPLFRQVWHDICLIQWDWDVLSPSEKWILALTRRAQGSTLDPPRLSPYLQAHPLVGRDVLLSELRSMTITQNRVAVAGMAGMGKTAIALTLARDLEMADYFAGGMLWAALGPNPDVLNTLSEWATTLGRQIPSNSTLLQRAHIVRNAIGTRRVLIVIDDAWEALPALQLACGGPNCCHLLLTRIQSVADEFVGGVDCVQIRELEDSESYELLAQIAPHVVRSVERPRIDQLIKDVGGLPLALVLLGGYLAAPEHRYFDNTISTRLEKVETGEHRLRLAQERLGSIDDRQLSLQQIIELSLDSLPLPVRRTFFYLGSFAPKPVWFTRTAAETVTSCLTEDLAILIDRNLLEIGHSEQLALHQVLADLARTKTPASVVLAHRNYYAGMAQEYRDDWHEVQQFYDQVRWAWYRQVESDPNDFILLQLVGWLSPFQNVRGLWTEALKWQETALEIARRNQLDDDTNALLNSIGLQHHNLGQFDLATSYYDEALHRSRQLGNLFQVATCLNNKGSVLKDQGELEQAFALYQEALKIRRELDDRFGQGVILNNIGTVLEDQGYNEDALDHYFRSLALRQEEEDIAGECSTLNNIGNMFINLQMIDEAEAYLQLALEKTRDAGILTTQSTVLVHLGLIRYRRGDLQQALEMYLSSAEMKQEVADFLGLARLKSNIADVYRGWHQFEEARCLLQEGLEIQKELMDKLGMASSYTDLADLFIHSEDLDQAMGNLKKSLELACEIGNRENQAYLLKLLGDGYIITEEYELACQQYELSMPILEELEELDGLRRVLFNHYLARAELGDLDEAHDSLIRSIELDRRLGRQDLEDDLTELDALRRQMGTDQ